jgi:hypothetical protein
MNWILRRVFVDIVFCLGWHFVDGPVSAIVSWWHSKIKWRV